MLIVVFKKESESKNQIQRRVILIVWLPLNNMNYNETFGCYQP